MLNIFVAATLLFTIAQDYRDYSATDDSGLSVPVRYYSPPYGGAPVIVVVHDWGGSIDRWEDVSAKLQKLGFGVVLFNLRGHDGSSIPYYRFSDVQIKDLQRDVALAVDFARKRAPGNIILMGAGLGANLALMVAAEDVEIGKIVALSPGLHYRGLMINGDMTEKLDGRVMLVASQEDSYSVFSIDIMARHFETAPEVKYYSNVGHGVWIIKRLPEALATVARWLSEG